jgi:hypothetical protein
MSKLTILGSGCLLLVGGALFAARRFPIGCLFMPCDRSVRFVLEPPEQPLEGCELVLFAPGDKTLSEPLRRLKIENHETEVIVQPRWNESFLAALGCTGSGLSNPELVDYRHKDSVNLHIRRPGG